MNKKQVRQSIINQRSALSASEAIEKSLIIQKRCLSSALFEQAQTIALYNSFNGEVETGLITSHVLNLKKRTVFPRIIEKNWTIRFYSVTSQADLHVNKYGFREPLCKSAQALPVSDIDLFIVPGVAYDESGNRLGLGKGCYDKALAGVDKKKIIALAYEFQLIKALEVDDHDVSVGWIITEDRFIET